MRRDLPQDICFPTTSRLRVVLPQLLTLILSEIVRGLGAKDFAFVRVFGTIRATRKTGDKGVTVFHNLTLTLFLRCIFQIPPCVNRKIVATRNARGMSARRHYDVSSFPTYLQQPHPPCPRKSLGWGGWLPARVGLC